MRIKSAAAHLRPYRMLANRRTTINHMFAAAIAPHDEYDASRVREAVALLGDDPDDDLTCAYCGAPAETWDHVFATVRNSRFSGHGHRLGNLLPCCKPCNSKKGNKDWRAHLVCVPMLEEDRERRTVNIKRYLSTFACDDSDLPLTQDRQVLDVIREQILSLMAEGDAVAARIRLSSAATPPTD